MTTRFTLPLAMACGIALAQAQAQPIYRCGDSYGSQPCAGGKPITPDPVVPSAVERRQSTADAQRDARLADGLEKERLKQEARPGHAYIPPHQAEPPPEPHKWPEKAATRKLDVFTATGPGTAPPKKEKSAKAGNAKADRGAGKGKSEADAAKTKRKADAPDKEGRKAPAGRLATSATR